VAQRRAGALRMQFSLAGSIVGGAFSYAFLSLLRLHNFASS
jgi:hypothetical protein